MHIAYIANISAYYIKLELTVYVHKFNCDGDVLVVIKSSNVCDDDGFMIDNAFSECLLDTNVNRLLSSIFNVLFYIIIIIHLLQLLWIISTTEVDGHNWRNSECDVLVMPPFSYRSEEELRKDTLKNWRVDSKEMKKVMNEMSIGGWRWWPGRL